MKKILLIGGAGYIGGLATDKLLEAGLDVTIYDNLLYEERYLKNVKFIHGDIRDVNKIKSLVNDYDVIVLLAALVGDPACSVDQVLTEEINYLAIKNICDITPKSKHIVFMSTCSVYGAQDGMLDETSPTNPLSSYASTKLKAEEHVLERGGTIFRLGTVFGLGDTYSRIRMDLVVNVLTMKAIKYGEITINGGDQWRPIISVIDIAGYITEACIKEHSGVYVLSLENVVIRELGEKIANLIPNTKIKYLDISFQDARNYKVDNSKALSTFTFKPSVTVEDEVYRMMTMLKENRIKDPEMLIYHNGGFLTELKKSKKFI